MPSITVFKGSSDGNPKKSTTEKPDELQGDQVLLRVTASGLCGTDMHYKEADIVLGHEGVGVVEALGPLVKTLKKGQRVGWGYQTDSCGHCAQCLQGQETFCPERAIYGSASLDQGSFSSHAIWREAFLHPIPDVISDEEAAPMQCGGPTVYSALTGIKASDTVGIMGVGGLGHLAIQFAAKMGCRVVVLSGSNSKRDLAMQLGAHRFIAMKDETPKNDKDWWPLNRLLVTTSVLPDWEIILPLMAPRGSIYPLSVSADNLSIPSLPLIQTGLTVQGSMIACRSVHREALDFAAFHGVKPILERYPMSEEGLKNAMDRLSEGKVEFRAVMVPQ